jgi:chromate reductase, NAD(P)H dehydrogenase (quinone)
VNRAATLRVARLRATLAATANESAPSGRTCEPEWLGSYVKILAVSGSLSGSSSNTSLLQLVRQAASQPADVVLYESLDDIPNFSPDRDQPAPPAVAAWRAAVSGADAVLIATPEYAGGMPGVLKNALDWLVGSGELYDKLAVVLSAAPSAQRGGRARESVELTLRMQGARVCDSFTVAVARDVDGEAFAATAGEVLARVSDGLLSGRCAAA